MFVTVSVDASCELLLLFINFLSCRVGNTACFQKYDTPRVVNMIIIEVIAMIDIIIDLIV